MARMTVRRHLPRLHGACPRHTGGTVFGVGMAYQVQTTPAAVTATWDDTNPIMTTIMSFKPAGSPPPSSVWSSSDATANAMTLSNNGLTFTSPPTNGFNTIRGTVGRTTGKYYVEFFTEWTGGNNSFGVASAGFDPVGKNLGTSNYSGGVGFPGQGSAGFTINYQTNTWADTANPCRCISG